MKKWIALLIAVLMMLTVCSCSSEKSVAAEAVDGAIDGIGEINDYSWMVLDTIEMMYNSLSKKEKKDVEKYDQYLKACEEYNRLRASHVVEDINALGTITLSSSEQLQEVREEFDLLNPAQQKFVANIQVLLDAEKTLSNLKVEDVKKEINTITYTGGEMSDGEAVLIETAKKAYEALSDAEKKQVSNYSKLENAQIAFSAFAVQRAQDAINAYLADGEGYQTAQNYYDGLTKEEQKQIKSYEEFQKKYEDFLKQPPLKLLGARIKKNWMDDSMFYLSAQNVAGQPIKEFSFSAFAYDETGLPITIDYGNDYIINCKYGKAIAINGTTSIDSGWEMEADITLLKQFVVVLKEVEFFDGTMWTNVNYTEECAEYEQQLLKADDPNILPKV